MTPLLPRPTLAAGAIIRWHLLGPWLPALAGTGRLDRVVDVGCGRGEHAVRLARRFRASVVLGVDKAGRDGVEGFAPIPTDLAARVTLREGEFSPAIVADLAPFDALLCVDVLEHVTDDRTFLRELAAVTRPGGRGLLHVPTTPQWHPVGWTRRALEGMLRDGTGQHVREGYRRDDLSALLRDTGWVIRDTRATFGRLAAWWCDADFYLAARQAHAVRALALPLTVAGAVGGRTFAPRRGNGWLGLIERR